MQIQADHHEHQQIKCAFIDHCIARIPVSIVFFYRKAIPSGLIVESLRKVLSDFPIFAGTFLFQENQLFINCNNQGVRLNIVHSSQRLLENFLKTSYIDPLSSKKGPVLTIKLSYFSDGMAIGYTWNHALGDMATFMEFLKSLSASVKKQTYPLPIILKNRDDLIKEKKEYTGDKLKHLNVLDIFYLLKEMVSPKKITYIYFNSEEIDNLRNTLSHQLGYKISKNTAICSHIFETLLRIRSRRKVATIAVNIRSHVKAASNSLGNFVDSAFIPFKESQSLQSIADSIHNAVNQFRPDCFDLSPLIQEAGGTKTMPRVMPRNLLPQEKNLLISSWTNFSAFTIDFGIEAPFLFLPMGKSPLSWVLNIVEGINNQGLLASLVLPPSATKRLLNPTNIQYLHRFRSKSETFLPDDLKTAFI